jgi:hypothetical protein
MLIVYKQLEQGTVVLHVKEDSHLQAQCRTCGSALSYEYTILPVATVRQMLVKFTFSGHVSDMWLWEYVFVFVYSHCAVIAYVWTPLHEGN